LLPVKCDIFVRIFFIWQKCRIYLSQKDLIIHYSRMYEISSPVNKLLGVEFAVARLLVQY
jgi:hypothetical protein